MHQGIINLFIFRVAIVFGYIISATVILPYFAHRGVLSVGMATEHYFSLTLTALVY